MEDMTDLARQIDVQVPRAVLEAVDQGKNPELVTNQLVQDLRKQNDEARARALATRALEELLRERLAGWN
jgi:hypothetical protein